MALLDTLTPEAIAERFYTLPQELQDALDSPDNRRAVKIACVTNGVGDPDELQNVEAIMAAVLLGLTHVDDLKETIAENLSLDPETAEKIASEVRSKVLEPLRGEIEKIYAPSDAPKAAAVDIAPAQPAAIPQAPPAPLPVTSGPAPLPPVPLPKAPTSGWQPTKLTIPPVQPTSPPTPPAAPTAAPAPFMMRKETLATPIAAETDFKLKIPDGMFKSAPAGPIEVPRPPKPAELEIGKAPLPPKPPGGESFRTTPSAPSRVIHYTDLRSAVSSSSGPIPSMPVPPTPMPKPPVVPSSNANSEQFPSSAKPAPPLPLIGTTPPAPSGPTVPMPPKKPPKVVNFGPEEVK